MMLCSYRKNANGASGWIVTQAAPLANSGQLLELAEGLANGVEIRQVLRGRSLLTVLHDSVFIDDKGGARAHRAQANQIRQQNAISFGGFFVEIAGKGNADLLLLRPGFLRNWAVDTHA